MQPPPQTAPPGVGGPPPLAPSWNMHWRNGPYGRRANAPTSAAAAAATGPVQPVTDPFAFGKQGPRSSPLSNAPHGDPGSSSLAFPPSTAPLHLSSGHLPQAPTPSLTSVSASHSEAGGSFSISTASMSASMSSFPKGVPNSTEMHPSTEHAPRPTVEPPQPMRIGPENSLSASVPDRLPGGPDVSRNPGNPGVIPPPLPAFSLLQQTVPQWMPPQNSAYLPSPEPLSRNAFGSAAHSSISVSQPGPQLDRHPTPPHQSGFPGAPQAPYMLAEASNVTLPPSSAWQSSGGTGAWAGQLPQEHFYLQPLEATYPSGHPTSQENSPPGQAQGVSEAGSRQCPDETDVGTISMFFKGDEAENEEILSSEASSHATRPDVDAFQQTMGHTYYQPLHGPQGVPAHFAPAQANAALAAEAAPKEADAQRFLRTAVIQQASEKAPFPGEDRASLIPQAGSCSASGKYENVENQECVQNQEVLPREPLSQNPSSPGTALDSSRYASLAPLLPKNHVGSHMEGGPNLEAPSMFPRPIRPDSVSSNYSNLSPRSAAGTARPQEPGTFIQQESGKPEQDASRCFFKQIDSSPLGAEVGEQEPGKNYHSPTSQVPTPSPPKPMGVFHTSVNSSFEPVRAHSLGVKPTETDLAKVVAELREDRPNQRSSQRSSAVAVASPGNLEQPPDNLETLFLPPAHSLPLSLAGGSGSPRQLPSGGAGMEKRPTTRAQGLGKKCESPATTLWAHNELPSFGGNVLLAPAAPAVYVPAKPSPQVVQPPEEVLPSKLGSQAGSLPSENLENPPKLGDEEAVGSQGSLGYASLLSSPPTETLQNQPILLAQPSQFGSLAPSAGSSLALQLGQPEMNPSAKDLGMSGALLLGKSRSCSLTGENPPGGLVHSNPSFFHCPLSTAETATPKSLLQSGSQGPLNLAMEAPQPPAAEGLPLESAGQPAAGVPLSHVSGVTPIVEPSNSLPGWSQNASHCQELSKPLDLAGAKSQEHGRAGPGQLLLGSQAFPLAPGLAGPSDSQARGPQQFYRQVTKDSGPSLPSNRGAPLEQVPTAIRHSSASPNLRMPPGNPCAQAPSPKPCPSGPLEGSSAPPPPSHPQPGTDFRQDPRIPSGMGPPLPPGSIAPSGPQSARPPSRQEQQYPSQNPQNAYGPPPNYYYYRNPYDSYSYPPVDPRAAHLYYQEAYGQYNSSYNQYDQSAAYRDARSYWYSEPERPSSRASHTSDRPQSRQDYPDDYYNTKSGWNGYYGDYYSNPYENGDRYSSNYDARFRDPRLYDQRYWYNTDQSLYQKREAYQQGNSSDRYEDHWRYDPRFVSSFDDDLEPRRDPYGDDSDWRSVHSEHSGHSVHSSHSLRSRQSSFSSRSQQSQRYRSNHDLSVNAYDGDPQPTSLHADYSSGGYYINQPSLNSYNSVAQIPWAGVEQVPSRPLTPEKFSVPHVCAKFGPGGQLIKVLPNLPSEGQPALVEIHSMEMVMQHSSEQEEMRAFPGPLTKDDTHKVDVINYAQNKATRCSQNDALIDKESARLLWDFVVLLCRQNGTVVGTDIAELLLQDHKTVWLPGKSPNEANLIDFTNEAVEHMPEESGEAQLSFLTDSLIATIDSLEKETERFRELLLYGRKKDALESAMKHGLWGHALLLASKMDSRTHARVMTRFANSLPINDPLQTVYQLMSGRMPAASTCCGDEKWGDWRPHLAMVLSNLTNNTDVESRTIVTMGDTLASKGLLDAAHFCYLMAQEGFGVYTKKTTKLVLIGANHSLPFLKFASNEAIQRTETYEYAQSLGTQPCSLPNFQVFKFIYACRLAEMGLIAQAFHYCEVISKAILTNPGCYSPVLISQVIQISSQLRLFDPQIKEKPEQELFIEPNWLIHLRHLDGQIKEGSFGYCVGRVTPQQYSSSTPSSEHDHISQNEGLGGGLDVSSNNPLLASLLPNMVQPVQLMPSGVTEPPVWKAAPKSGEEDFYGKMAIMGPGRRSRSTSQSSAHMGLGRRSRTTSESSVHSVGRERRNSAAKQPSPPPPSIPERKKTPKEAKKELAPQKSGGNWLSWLMGKSKHEAHLPDDKNKSIVWDEKKQRWINLDEPEEESKPPPPPPTGFPQAAPSGLAGPPNASVNKFSRRAAGSKVRYVDIMNPSKAKSPVPALAPADLFAPLAPMPIPANMFVPNSVPEEQTPLEGGVAQDQMAPGNNTNPESTGEVPYLNSASFPPGPELPVSNPGDAQSGELSRSSSMSSLSREVSQHLNQASSGDPSTGAVQFYNPSQFAQPSAAPASSRLGRFGQRKYPTLK
ncbi:protein transport protein Sec16A isoform X7 [Ahaetulla prasina]|uniref:protein transport protein Sec16A isoform X6 n=1 Tax=Ahaetulla prasina TaxID=499056 RepID=UPI0026482C79|nr:protein transport protein Sec16A isoform X6 [Ahaetulla prasina]XP_058015121.1 protein transport protein Sec16A isoform X7 [Ahaetulla prasina]